MFPNKDLFIIIVTLFTTYFIFELNNSILMQIKELKTSVTKLKKNRIPFAENLLIPYIEDRRRGAVITVFTLYLVFFMCIAAYVLFEGGFLFYVSITIFSFWLLLISFPLDIDELPLYKAVVESENMIKLLEQLDIGKGTEEFEKILEWYFEANQLQKSEEEKTELISKIFEELP